MFSILYGCSFVTRFGCCVTFVRNFREWALKDACGMETTYILAYGDTYRDLYWPALIIAACFAFTASVFSILLIFQHLRSYNNPAVSSFSYVLIESIRGS